MDEFATDVCGTDIYHEISGKGTIKFYEDGLIVDHFNITTTSWNPATGDTVIRKEAATFRGMGEEIFDEATQTVTINFEDMFVGLPSKWYKPGEGVILRDAGSVTFAGTVVLDVSNPDEPVLISIDETMTINGPHDELETDFDEVVDIICGAHGA